MSLQMRYIVLNIWRLWRNSRVANFVFHVHWFFQCVKVKSEIIALNWIYNAECRTHLPHMCTMFNWGTYVFIKVISMFWFDKCMCSMLHIQCSIVTHDNDANSIAIWFNRFAINDIWILCAHKSIMVQCSQQFTIEFDFKIDFIYWNNRKIV